jgi:peptidoglycan hydrolase CwlO-like protein
MPPFTATNTIYCAPTTSTTTSTSATISPTIYTTVGPTSISLAYENTEEKMREYCDKVDQHVDKLEEDIEFLNEKRKLNEEHIENLINQNLQKDTTIKELTARINSLQGYINYLVDRISVLEGKINE